MLAWLFLLKFKAEKNQCSYINKAIGTVVLSWYSIHNVPNINILQNNSLLFEQVWWGGGWTSKWGMCKSGGRLNKKDGLTRYGDSHVKDKTS